MSEDLLTPRWRVLEPHPKQIAWMQSKARFNVIPAGRRSGKTERAKRKLIRRALEQTEWDSAHYFAAAPTRDQAKRLYWDDLKALIPRELRDGAPRESELIIKLINGSNIHVVGMDKPERIEGSPWNGGILDEYGNMKKTAWELNIYPALADRKGWCDIIGVPEGRNHYYDLYKLALANETGEWAAFTWKSSELLHLKEITAVAKKQMDDLSYQQEFEASFINFQGRIYYGFDSENNCSSNVRYNPHLPLIFCFDFNVAPGVAAILQELPKLPCGNAGTAVIGEVYIPRNSNTVAVCNKLLKDWGDHKNGIMCYGDSTGGNDGTAKLNGSDWDIIRRELKPTFGDSLRFNVPPANGPERSRVNAVNTRIKSGKGKDEIYRLMVNPKCARVIKDFEGVKCLDGGSGEIDKKSDKDLTHISDAIGYYIANKFPIVMGSPQKDF